MPQIHIPVLMHTSFNDWFLRGVQGRQRAMFLVSDLLVSLSGSVSSTSIVDNYIVTNVINNNSDIFLMPLPTL